MGDEKKKPLWRSVVYRRFLSQYTMVVSHDSQHISCDKRFLLQTLSHRTMTRKKVNVNEFSVF